MHFVYNGCDVLVLGLLLRVRFDSLQTITTNYLYLCRHITGRYFVMCTSSIHFKLSTTLQAARLRRYPGRCSLRLWRQSTFAYCSQGVPQIFMAPVCRAHCAVIFALAQLSFFHQGFSAVPTLLFYDLPCVVHDQTIAVVFYCLRPPTFLVDFLITSLLTLSFIFL